MGSYDHSNLSEPSLVLATCVLASLLVWLAMGWFRGKVKFDGKHVFITGGSSGIGLALAEELVRQHAYVTIVARTQSKLDEARKSLQATIEKSSLTARVHCISADVTDFSQAERAVKEAEEAFGQIEYALCCAGAAFPGRFLDQGIDIFVKTVQVDYFGSLHIAKAVLPSMVQRRGGHLLLTSSPLSSIGYVGYSTYCPSKYAVRGLADVLRNELVGTGVKISIGYPLDTDTPGFANENLTKPPETEAITRFTGGAVCSAEKTAKGFVKGLRSGAYHIKTSDFIVNLLISSTSNITPKCYPLLLETLLAPLVVILLGLYRLVVDGFVKRQRRRESQASHLSTA